LFYKFAKLDISTHQTIIKFGYGWWYPKFHANRGMPLSKT
jgi:hypothetical protein